MSETKTVNYQLSNIEIFIVLGFTSLMGFWIWTKPDLTGVGFACLAWLVLLKLYFIARN